MTSEHRTWCSGPHVGSLCSSEPHQVADLPASVTVQLEQPADAATAPVVALDAVFAAGAVLASIELSLTEAADLRAALDELLALAATS